MEKENRNEIKEDCNSFYKGTKPMLIIALVITVGGLLFSGKSYFIVYYPYILMILGAMAFTFIKDRKLGGLIFLFVLSIILPIQLFYYGVIPLHENYIPITVPYMQQIFQMFGKFHIVYYPDFPQQGDTITAYVNLCDNDIKNCTMLNNYTITAYFKDEGNIKHELIHNETIEESFSLDYHGKPIYISFSNDNTPRFNEFMIPKPSFYQSVMEIVPKHPFFTLLSGISTLLGLGVLANVLKKAVMYVKNKKKKSQLV